MYKTRGRGLVGASLEKRRNLGRMGYAFFFFLFHVLRDPRDFSSSFFYFFIYNKLMSKRENEKRRGPLLETTTTNKEERAVSR